MRHAVAVLDSAEGEAGECGALEEAECLGTVAATGEEGSVPLERQVGAGRRGRGRGGGVEEEEEKGGEEEEWEEEAAEGGE